MAIFKCENCGANLNYFKGESTLTCEYCGAVHSLDEKRILSFDASIKPTRQDDGSNPDDDLLERDLEALDRFLLKGDFAGFKKYYDTGSIGLRRYEILGRNWRFWIMYTLYELGLNQYEDFNDYCDYDKLNRAIYFRDLAYSDNPKVVEIYNGIKNKILENSNNGQTDQAKKAMADKDYVKAAQILNSVITRTDYVNQLLNEAYSEIYKKAMDLYEHKAYKGAASLFDSCIDYADAYKYKRKCDESKLDACLDVSNLTFDYQHSLFSKKLRVDGTYSFVNNAGKIEWCRIVVILGLTSFLFDLGRARLSEPGTYCTYDIDINDREASTHTKILKNGKTPEFEFYFSIYAKKSDGYLHDITETSEIIGLEELRGKLKAAFGIKG